VEVGDLGFEAVGIAGREAFGALGGDGGFGFLEGFGFVELALSGGWVLGFFFVFCHGWVRDVEGGF